ncbi:MAG TPA: hypothetical protein VNU95_12980, partial [Candidatus Acidoferrales bacterium]|nr:hypothetical protein [Candidatus Acidoferrales bacterium]
MKKLAFVLYLGLLLCTTTFAGTVNGSHAGTDGSLVPMIPAPEGLTINEVHFDGQLSGDEARFILNVDAIAASKGESSTPLLEGDVAVLPPQLPDSLKIVRDGSRYLLMSSHAGEFKFKLEVVARIEHDGQWNRVSFTGPSATIASVSAQATGADTEIQLLNGTLMESVKTNGVSRLAGFLGADQTVALRWQTRVAEVAHKALSTVDSGIAAQVTSTVIKYTDKFHYDIVQGSTTELTLALPSAQTLTHIDGPQIRDWNLAADGDRQILTVEFIKPL